MHLKISSLKWWPFCPGEDELIQRIWENLHYSCQATYTGLPPYSGLGLPVHEADCKKKMKSRYSYWHNIILIYDVLTKFLTGRVSLRSRNALLSAERNPDLVREFILYLELQLPDGEIIDFWCKPHNYFEGLVQERHNSIANALELRLSCTNPSISAKLVMSAHMTWWRHQMETFCVLLALCVGNSPVPVISPHKDQWRRALMSSLICARMND